MFYILKSTSFYFKKSKFIPPGIVRETEDFGEAVIPKKIRRTMQICEGYPLLTILTPFDKFCFAIHSVVERYNKTAE